MSDVSTIARAYIPNSHLPCLRSLYRNFNNFFLNKIFNVFFNYYQTLKHPVFMAAHFHSTNHCGPLCNNEKTGNKIN